MLEYERAICLEVERRNNQKRQKEKEKGIRNILRSVPVENTSHLNIFAPKERKTGKGVISPEGKPSHTALFEDRTAWNSFKEQCYEKLRRKSRCPDGKLHQDIDYCFHNTCMGKMRAKMLFCDLIPEKILSDVPIKGLDWLSPCPGGDLLLHVVPQLDSISEAGEDEDDECIVHDFLTEETAEDDNLYEQDPNTNLNDNVTYVIPLEEETSKRQLDMVKFDSTLLLDNDNNATYCLTSPEPIVKSTSPQVSKQSNLIDKVQFNSYSSTENSVEDIAKRISPQKEDYILNFKGSEEEISMPPETSEGVTVQKLHDEIRLLSASPKSRDDLDRQTACTEEYSIDSLDSYVFTPSPENSTCNDRSEDTISEPLMSGRNITFIQSPSRLERRGLGSTNDTYLVMSDSEQDIICLLNGVTPKSENIEEVACGPPESPEGGSTADTDEEDYSLDEESIIFYTPQQTDETASRKAVMDNNMGRTGFEAEDHCYGSSLSPKADIEAMRKTYDVAKEPENAHQITSQRCNGLEPEELEAYEQSVRYLRNSLSHVFVEEPPTDEATFTCEGSDTTDPDWVNCDYSRFEQPYSSTRLPPLNIVIKDLNTVFGPDDDQSPEAQDTSGHLQTMKFMDSNAEQELKRASHTESNIEIFAESESLSSKWRSAQNLQGLGCLEGKELNKTYDLFSARTGAREVETCKDIDSSSSQKPEIKAVISKPLHQDERKSDDLESDSTILSNSASSPDLKINATPDPQLWNCTRKLPSKEEIDISTPWVGKLPRLASQQSSNKTPSTATSPRRETQIPSLPPITQGLNKRGDWPVDHKRSSPISIFPTETPMSEELDSRDITSLTEVAYTNNQYKNPALQGWGVTEGVETGRATDASVLEQDVQGDRSELSQTFIVPDINHNRIDITGSPCKESPRTSSRTRESDTSPSIKRSISCEDQNGATNLDLYSINRGRTSGRNSGSRPGTPHRENGRSSRMSKAADRVSVYESIDTWLNNCPRSEDKKLAGNLQEEPSEVIGYMHQAELDTFLQIRHLTPIPVVPRGKHPNSGTMDGQLLSSGRLQARRLSALPLHGAPRNASGIAKGMKETRKPLPGRSTRNNTRDAPGNDNDIGKDGGTGQGTNKKSLR